MKTRIIFFSLFILFSNKSHSQFEWALNPIMETSNFIYRPEVNENYIELIVEGGKKEGVLNKQGEVILDPNEFQKINFVPGNEIVRGVKADGKVVLMNKSRKIIGNEFDEVNPYLETNLILVRKKNVWGIMDTSGVTIVKPRYRRINKISRGKLKGTLADNSEELFQVEETSGMNPHQEDKQLKLHSSKMKDRIMINSKSDRVHYDFWGFTNMSGDTLLSPNRYYSKYHMMKYDEQVLIAIDSRTDKQGVFDKDGKIIIPFQYDKINHLLYYNHFIAKLDGKYGLLDMKGNIVLPFDHYYISPTFKNNYLTTRKSKRVTLLDSNFQKVYEEDVKLVSKITGQIIRLFDGKHFGFYSLKTKRLTKPRFKRIMNSTQGVKIVAAQRNFGLFDIHSGKMLTEMKYKHLEQKGNFFYGDYLFRDSILEDSVYKKFNVSRRDLLNPKGEVLYSPTRTSLTFITDDIVHFKVFRQYSSDSSWIIDFATNQKIFITGENYTYYSSGKEENSCKVLEIDKRFYFLDDLLNGNNKSFSFIGRLKEGLRVYRKDGLFGFIREKEIITPPIYDKIGSFNKDLIAVKYKGKWGILKNSYYKQE